MRPVRITFRGVDRREHDWELVFAVELVDGVYEAGVLVRPGGSPKFPHGLYERGRSLGAVADAELRERAAQVVALLDGAADWSDFRWAQRTRRRQPGDRRRKGSR